MSKSTPKLKFQIVQWIDAKASSGWLDYDKTKDYGVDVVTSAGWLVRDTKHFITLAGSISGPESNNAMSIPKGWVLKTKTINLDKMIQIDKDPETA